MGNLGCYWSVMHRRPQDYEYFRGLKPAVIKIMDGGPNDYQWVRENLAESLVMARDWALSEQHGDMLRDPVGTGKRHAQEWNRHQQRLGFDKTKTFILGINEPRVWEEGVPEALRLYTISLCNESSSLGLRVGAMQLSVGWPNNRGGDSLPDWSPWHGVDVAIRANNGVLVAHEYWADGGPSENFGWWAGRVLKCPWAVPIIIGECGVDMFVKTTSVPHAGRGWRGRMSPERYAAELADYTMRMSEDARFVGNCVFASDYASHEWYSFDIEPAYQAILAQVIADRTPSAYTVRLPLVSGGEEYQLPTVVVDVVAGANIRSGPGTNYAKLGAEPQGTALMVVGRNLAGDWWQVDSRFGAGWVSDIAVAPYKVESVPVTDSSLPDAGTAPQPDDAWFRSREFVRRWEGGYQSFEWDAGNWTGCQPGVGELKGTNFGISACSYPELDIKNLSMTQADEIYYKDYWLASGADKLPWPYCLVVFDTAVLHGVGAAREWLSRYGPDMNAFVARRLSVYVQSNIWDQVGNAWVRRVAELLLAASDS